MSSYQQLWVIIIQTMLVNSVLSMSWNFFPGPVTWQQGYQSCGSIGMELVTLQTEDEISAFQTFLISEGPDTNTRIWIGMNIAQDSDMEEDLRWVDMNPVTVKKWDDDEPNNLDDMKCVLIQADDDFNWNTLPCDEIHPYVCQPKSQQVNEHGRVFQTNAYFSRISDHEPCGEDAMSLFQRNTKSMLSCAAFCLEDIHCTIITLTDSKCTRLLKATLVPCECLFPNCTAFFRNRWW